MPPGVFTLAVRARMCCVAGDLEFWGSALRDGNSAEMLRSEEQQGSFVACLYYSVFNLLEGGSVLQEMMWIKQSVSTSFTLEG